MRKSILCGAMLALIFTFSINKIIAQDKKPFGKNIIKGNVGALIFKTMSGQYERVISKKISICIGARYMPMTSLPFKGIAENTILKNYVGWDAYGSIKFDISNRAVTPEVRYYFGKGYGRGFYLAPFVRWARYKANSELHYNVELLGKTYAETIPIDGGFSTVTGGFMLGAQWKLAKVLYLDWWILGPQYGGVKGSFTGTRPLTKDAQEAVKQAAEYLDVPFMNKEVTVNSTGVKIDLSGPWAGVRAGLCVGLRF